jgi:twitching motility protein PilT
MPDSYQEIVDKYLKEIMSQDSIERFYVNKELDFSLAFSQKARFRVNAYTQKGSFAISFRTIPIEIMDIDTLGLPKILHSFTNLRQGFI